MLGYESAVVNGQLVPIAPKQGYDPLAFGAAYTGPGMWPRQGVYNVPPVMPAPSLQYSMAPASYGQSGTYPFPTAVGPGGNPLHGTRSPVLWAAGFLAAGLGLLYFVHYKE